MVNNFFDHIANTFFDQSTVLKNMINLTPLKPVIIGIFFLFNFQGFAQIIFDPGYLIMTDGERIECLIRNAEWRNNPSKIQYKLPGTEEVKIAEPRDIIEFGITNKSRYRVGQFKIDRSSIDINHLSLTKEPEFSQEYLMLKYLVSGKTSLLVYQDETFLRFFYETEDSNVEQLIYKLYYNHEGNENENYSSYWTKENNSFRQQLKAYVNCGYGDNPLNNMVGDLDYKASELRTYFNKYNECSNSEYIDFQKLNKRNPLNLSLRPGIGMTKFTYSEQGNDVRNIDSSPSWQGGLEFEFLLPFSKDRWAILFEPTYFIFEGQKSESHQLISTTYETKIKARYEGIDASLGLRYYYELNDQSKLFANGSFIVGFPMGESYALPSGGYPSKTGTYFTFDRSYTIKAGIGYKHANRLSAELSYVFKRDMLLKYLILEGYLSTVSLTLGYTLIQSN